MEVPDARLGHDKTLDLVAKAPCLEPGCPLILGFDWITANCEKLRVTEPYGLELKRVFEIEEMTHFSEFGEILKQSQYVGLIHVDEWETRSRADGTMRRVMTITAAEDLDALASRLPAQYRDFVGIFGTAAQASLPTHGPQDMVIDLEPGK